VVASVLVAVVLVAREWAKPSAAVESDTGDGEALEAARIQTFLHPVESRAFHAERPFASLLRGAP
jgi:hypothetical protein